jgi:hypothetical protein
MNRSLLRTIGLPVLLLLLPFLASAQGNAMEVIFKPDMDKLTLDKIQEEAKVNGLELTYTHVERKDERITALAFVLNTKAGMGTAETVALSEDKPFGFRYDPRAAAGEAAFSVGTLVPVRTAEPGKER